MLGVDHQRADNGTIVPGTDSGIFGRQWRGRIQGLETRRGLWLGECDAAATRVCRLETQRAGTGAALHTKDDGTEPGADGAVDRHVRGDEVKPQPYRRRRFKRLLYGKRHCPAGADRHLDILSIIPHMALGEISAIAGRGSILQKKHRVRIDYVQVANYPDNSESRLIRIFPIWSNLRLWALEPHDLALTKLTQFRTRHARRDVLGSGRTHQPVLAEIVPVSEHGS